jgi:transporter family protein
MQEYRWLVYAILSALCAAFVSIFGKLGMEKIDPNVATAARSVVMTVALILFVAATRGGARLPAVSGRGAAMILLSGLAGAASWLFYFNALKLDRVSRVGPIDKLSMPLAVVLAVIILGERPTALNWAGILLIAAGAYLATVPPGR